MIAFHALPLVCRCLFGLWTLLLCAAGAVCVVMAFGIRRYRYVLPALPVLAAAYLLWQVTMDLNRHAPEVSAPVSGALGGVPWLGWAALLLCLTAAAAVILHREHRVSRNQVTPFVLKQCGEQLPCGICYWQDNGHVIFSNDCIDRLCRALTGKPLMNGSHFSGTAAGRTLPVDGRVWRFVSREVAYRGKPLHELIATDVTELNAKADTLRQENLRLTRLNEELRAYNLRIDETVRRQEILQAKVNIHDEMNRLMLSTVTADAENPEEMDRVFSLWERNALLLCLQAEEKKDENAIRQINGLAQGLGIRLIWQEELPGCLTPKQRELCCLTAREAIVNAVKHARAQQVRISFTHTPSGICCCFENDGDLPEGDVRFLGGLANISRLAMDQGAELQASTGDTFCLTLCMRKER